MLKKVKEILDKRSKINDEDDYRIEKCRDELIDALSQDELLTIDILNQLNVNCTPCQGHFELV